MSFSIGYTKTVSSNIQQFQEGKSRAETRRLGAIIAGRREILLSSSTCILTAAAAAAATDDQADDSRTALLQKYLKKSQENKAKNDKERLENYYKRNYRDYFGLLEGSLRAKEDEQLSESEKGILDWLQKNK